MSMYFGYPTFYIFSNTKLNIPPFTVLLNDAGNSTFQYSLQGMKNYH